MKTAKKDLDNQISATLARINDLGQKALHSGNFDELSVKELRLRALKQTESIMANDEKASVISVVVWVVVT